MKEEKHDAEPKAPDWEMKDPKPPVINSGHMEDRKR